MPSPPPTLPNIVSICLYTHSLTSSFNLCKLIVNYYLPGNVVIIDIRRVVSGFLTLIFQLKFLWSFGLVSDVYAWKYGFHWYSRTIQTTWPNWNRILRNLKKNILYRCGLSINTNLDSAILVNSYLSEIYHHISNSRLKMDSR